MSEMTEEDWKKLNGDWSESMSSLDEEPVECNTIDYTRKGNETTKAVFYVTEDMKDETGVTGFWVPKSAIISDKGSKVEIADWCEIKMIYYV